MTGQWASSQIEALLHLKTVQSISPPFLSASPQSTIYENYTLSHSSCAVIFRHDEKLDFMEGPY